MTDVIPHVPVVDRDVVHFKKADNASLNKYIYWSYGHD